MGSMMSGMPVANMMSMGGMMPMMVPMVPMMPMGGMGMGMGCMNPMAAMSAMATMATMANMASMASMANMAAGVGAAAAASTGGGGSSSTAGGVKKTTSKSGSGAKGAVAVPAFSHVDLQERLLRAQSDAAAESAAQRLSPSPERPRARRRSPAPRARREGRTAGQAVATPDARQAPQAASRGAAGTGTGAAAAGSPKAPTPDSPQQSDQNADAARRLEHEIALWKAKMAAAEINVALETKSNSPPELEIKPEGPKPLNMGVVIHWSGIRGFGILRSQAHGEIFVHAKSLANCTELVVGDVVTFEMGFDRKKQKPEALNCVKAGVGGYRPPDRFNPEGASMHQLHENQAHGDGAGAGATLGAGLGGQLGRASITCDPKTAAAMGTLPAQTPAGARLGTSWDLPARPQKSAGQACVAHPEEGAGGAPPVDDALLAGAAAAAALKLLSQGLGGPSAACRGLSTLATTPASPAARQQRSSSASTSASPRGRCERRGGGRRRGRGRSGRRQSASSRGSRSRSAVGRRRGR